MIYHIILAARADNAFRAMPCARTLRRFYFVNGPFPQTTSTQKCLLFHNVFPEYTEDTV